MTPDSYISLGVVVITGLIWAIRLEGRINVLDSRWDDIRNRLSRIEDVLDKIRNGR